MSVADHSEGSADRSVVIRLPHWVRVAAAFVAGGALVAASLVQFAPRGLTRIGAGGEFFSEEGGEFFSEDGELLPGEAGDLTGSSGGGRGRRLSTSTSGGASGSGGSAGRAGGTSGRGSSVGGGASGSSGGSGSGTVECRAGRNGGATAKGVTGTSIRLATTAVLDGEAASLLRDSVTGIRAVLQKVNQGGGICGRRLDLVKVDNDGFDAQRGLSYIRNYAEADYFALPVVPSAEGLGAAIQSRVIDDAGIPVVGTDGMRIEQYQAKAAWVWPVATATESTMRIMAKYGRQVRGAQTFAIVWDSKYKFGQEGHDAFVELVSEMGGVIAADFPLDPDKDSYSTDVNEFNGKCGGGKCDMVALLLLPDTADRWLLRTPALGRLYTSGAQTLFTNKFGHDCAKRLGSSCHGVAAWTGYNPPIGPLASSPGVAAYKSDVEKLNPSIDARNQFIEGAYLGTSVFVEALRRVGPGLTRAALRNALDSMDYTSDLSGNLSWRPGNHSANAQAQSFSMNVSGGQFFDWAKETDWIRDPKL